MRSATRSFGTIASFLLVVGALAYGCGRSAVSSPAVTPQAPATAGASPVATTQTQGGATAAATAVGSSSSIASAPSATPGSALFRAPVHLDAPVGPITVGDFDGDGNLDIAGVKEDGGVSLLLGLGDGSFDVGIDLPGGEGPVAIAAADLNDDARLDIVLTHTGFSDMGFGADDVVVLLAKSDGSFQRIARPAGVNPQAVVVGDFNSDKKPDLVTADKGDHVSLFIGRGDGTFEDPANFPIGAPFSSGIAASDFNGDGTLDVVTTNSLVGFGQSNRTVSVLLGGADGSFDDPKVFPAGDRALQPVTPVVADLNGDGAMDIAMAGGHPSPGVTVLFGLGDGQFSPATDFASGPNPYSIAVADLDGDKHLDLVAGNVGEGGGPIGEGISILFGVGDGTFEPEIDLSGTGLGEEIGAAADLDNDGAVDLIVIGNGELLLHFNTARR